MYVCFTLRVHPNSASLISSAECSQWLLYGTAKIQDISIIAEIALVDRAIPGIPHTSVKLGDAHREHCLPGVVDRSFVFILIHPRVVT